MGFQSLVECVQVQRLSRRHIDSNGKARLAIVYSLPGGIITIQTASADRAEIDGQADQRNICNSELLLRESVQLGIEG